MKSHFAILFALVAATGGCARPQPSSQQLQLECRYNQDPKSAFTLIYQLDPLTTVARIANMPGQPTGSFTTTPFEYRMTFPGDSLMGRNDAVIRRYDGMMTREFGKPPFAMDVLSVPPGNTMQIWICKKQSYGPLF